jgi:hypothetical protein
MTVIDKTKTTSIFYVNSMGFMSQWKGKILDYTDTSISIQFSKNKAFKYNLTDCQFCLVTNTLMKDQGVTLTSKGEAISFDDSLIQEVLTKTKGNVYKIWQN